jgi:PAS domain S-box-containing protein
MLAGHESFVAALLAGAAATLPAAVGAALLGAPHKRHGPVLRPAAVTVLVALTTALAAGVGEPWPDVLRTLPLFVVAAALPVAVLRLAPTAADIPPESFLAALLDNLPAVVFLKDARGRYAIVNCRFESFMGRDRADLLGRNDRELFSLTQAEIFEGEDREVLATGRVLEFVQEIPMGGVMHVFLMSKFPLLGPDGVPHSVGGVASDITESRRLFQALQRSEARLRQVVECSSNLFYVMSTDHVLTYVSPQARHFLGCAPEEATVHWAAFVQDPASRRRSTEAVDRAIRTGERQPAYEIEVRSRDGRALWVEVNEAPVVREGRTVAIAGALTDIDDRRRAELGLRRALSLLEATLEASAEGLLVVDRTQRVTRYNRRFAEIWRVPPELLASGEDEPLLAFVTHQLADPVAFLTRVRELYEHPEEESLDILHLADTRILERYSRPQRLDGEVVGRVWSFRDVTTRWRAEEELRRHRDHLAEVVEERTRELTTINHELETFAYTVSHDLRAPLRAIDGFSRVLLDDASAVLDDASKGHLARVRGAVGRMASLIDDLLEFTRVGRGTLRTERIDLAALACSIVADLRAGDPARDVVLQVDRPLPVEGDSTLLRSLLQNLLDNAWKFSAGRTPAHIVVGERDEGGEHVYFVGDDGAGFDMAYAARLFIPFERLHGVGEFEGTGIGLATVKRIAERHGGRVWAESKVGCGATFYFTLGPRKG